MWDKVRVLPLAVMEAQGWVLKDLPAQADP